MALTRPYSWSMEDYGFTGYTLVVEVREREAFSEQGGPEPKKRCWPRGGKRQEREEACSWRSASCDCHQSSRIAHHPYCSLIFVSDPM